jgi:saposin
MKLLTLVTVVCFCVAFAFAHVNPKAEVSSPQDQTCTICQLVAGYAEDYLKNNATEQQILQFVEGVCLLFPSQFRPQCRAFIDQEGQQLIKLLLQKFPPNVLCARLGLCPGRVVPTYLQNGQYCMICEFVVQTVDGYLQNNKTVVEIEQYLDAFCNRLPPNFNTQCVQFVHTYLPLVIQWIITTERPDVFCTQIGLCTKIN